MGRGGGGAIRMEAWDTLRSAKKKKGKHPILRAHAYMLYLHVKGKPLAIPQANCCHVKRVEFAAKAATCAK